MPVTINGTSGVTTPGLASTAMPTSGGDPVVERGTNSDGEWIKFADGTQICTAYFDAALFGATTVAYGSIYGSNSHSWTFPLAFISGAVRVSFAARKSAGAGLVWVAMGTGTVNDVEASNVRLASGNNDGAGDVRAIAIGRWK